MDNGCVLAIARQDLRVLRADPAYLVVFTLIPLLLMGFLEPAIGADQAVPGLTMMFSFFMMANLGLGVFREHGWGMWDRLLASRARPVEIIAGKSLVPLAALAVQIAVFLTVGGLLFDMHIEGSIVALVAVAAALTAVVICLGLLLLSFATTVMSLNALCNLCAIVFAGLGGTFAPVDQLPGWARAIAPLTPGYWAMLGLQDVIVDGATLADVVEPVLVLLAFSTAFAVGAALRFRAKDAKTVSWA